MGNSIIAGQITENKKFDRRSNRTQQSLRKAIKEIILEKHYDEITVQNIIDRADVGRSTFYAHYRDKEDLFRGDWERFLGFLIQHIDFEKIGKGGFVPIKMLFQHLIDFHPFYRVIVKSRKSERLFRIGQNHLAKAIERKLTLLPGNEQPAFVPIPIMANYLANEIFTLLLWWLEQNMPYTPERMDEIFHQLITPGFRAAFGNK
jgi:AcrR family transcriptional regulator